MNLKNAIINSCNIYFYKLGLSLGYNKILNVLKNFETNKLTGINLPFEKKSIIPTKEYLKKNKISFSKGDLVNLSISQGLIALTPIPISS